MWSQHLSILKSGPNRRLHHLASIVVTVKTWWWIISRYVTLPFHSTVRTHGWALRICIKHVEVLIADFISFISILNATLATRLISSKTRYAIYFRDIGLVFWCHFTTFYFTVYFLFLRFVFLLFLWNLMAFVLWFISVLASVQLLG